MTTARKLNLTLPCARKSCIYVSCTTSDLLALASWPKPDRSPCEELHLSKSMLPICSSAGGRLNATLPVPNLNPANAAPDPPCPLKINLAQTLPYTNEQVTEHSQLGTELGLQVHWDLSRVSSSSDLGKLWRLKSLVTVTHHRRLKTKSLFIGTHSRSVSQNTSQNSI